MVAEPIARLYLEGGYDSNPLYDGGPAARSARLSPEVGLRLRAPLWSARGTYGGELVYLDWSSPEQLWNHRAGLALDARLTRRTSLAGSAHLSQAVDPAGLARVGVFRTGRHRALVVNGRARVDWRAERDVSLGATLLEEIVRFDDRSGGAVHAPGVEALWRRDRHLWIGAGYALGIFQSFDPAPGRDLTSYAHAVRARARWQATRQLSVSAWGGPALWLDAEDGRSFVPEGFAEVLLATRGLDLRVDASHALGIGATARPGVVDALEFGAERRFGRRWFARGDGGMWRSGLVPDGRDGVTGYAIGGEAGIRLENDLRLSVTAARYGRVDAPSGGFGRTTVGMRLGWELAPRR